MTTTFSDPPRTAGCQHRDARNGFEVVFLRTDDDGFRIEAHTAAIEDGQAWAVESTVSWTSISKLANAFPVHRLGLQVGQEADAPAAYVRALDLSVERLDQHHARGPNDGNRQRYHYTSPHSSSRPSWSTTRPAGDRLAS